MTVTKGSGKYFYSNDRVWDEAMETGFPPAWLGDPGKFGLPAAPDKASVKALCEGTDFLSRVVKDRVGAFDLTFTWSKDVSIVLYGLTDPKEWSKSTAMLDAVIRPRVQELMASMLANEGRAGAAKIPATGIALPFHHWRSEFGQFHAHTHVAVPNIVFIADGKFGSIANARIFFERQGVLRAATNKELDDRLQERGFATVRVGKTVGLANIPDLLRRQLSPAREAIDKLIQEMKYKSPKATDVYARMVRREMPDLARPTPAEAQRNLAEKLKQHNVTLESLKKSPEQALAAKDETRRQHIAYDVCREAIADCKKRLGIFSADHLRESMLTLGIGRETTLNELDRQHDKAMSQLKAYGMRKAGTRDGERYFEAREKRMPILEIETALRMTLDELRKAAVEVGRIVLVKLTEKVEAVRESLKAMRDDGKQVKELDGRRIAAFLEEHLPEKRSRAHKAAFWAFIFASGNPHQRAAAAERVFAAHREHKRVRAKTKIVVRNSDALTDPEVRQLKRIAKRDKCELDLLSRKDWFRARAQEKDERTRDEDWDWERNKGKGRGK